MLKYRYERLLGEGTNGKTYLATDLNTGDKLAIKALKLNQNDSFKSFELFKREAETLASLNVAGVPKFYESILSDEINGESYIVQEYIKAPSIQVYLDNKRKFSEEETLILMQKTAEILHTLHSQYSPPVIHRDIKPSNILCELPTDGNWKNIQPYLIDFGAVANAHSNTDKSTIAGTIGYMAPEQNFGECLPQTDLYALGATALHMLTGQPPYEMDFDTFSLKYETALDKYAPDTSPKMRELLGKLLDYSYDNRPPSANALIEEINKILIPETQEVQKPKSKLRAFAEWLEKKRNTTDLQMPPPEQMPQFFFTQVANAIDIVTKMAIGDVWICDYFHTEYTFEAEGISWAGVQKLQNLHKYCDKFTLETLKKDHPNLNPISPTSVQMAIAVYQAITSDTQIYDYRNRLRNPAKGIILYHADDPSCNRLLYIIPDKSDDQQACSNE